MEEIKWFALGAITALAVISSLVLIACCRESGKWSRMEEWSNLKVENWGDVDERIEKTKRK